MKRAFFCLLAAAILAALSLAACDDFNRPVKDEIEFYRNLTPVGSWAELEAAAQNPNTKIIAVTHSFPAEGPTIPINHALTITAVPDVEAQITRQGGFTYSFFTVNGAGDLTLGHPLGGSLTLDGGADLEWDPDLDHLVPSGVTAWDALVHVTGGNLTMNGGITLRNNAISTSFPNNAYGGGVWVDGGTFVMGGNAVISGNWVSGTGSYGGGVAVTGGGTFVMNGNAVISGNTNVGGYGGYGGGVAVYEGDFTMSGNAVIRDNTVKSGSYDGKGGGVFVAAAIGASTFTMSGNAVISDNTVSGRSYDSHGGGVSVAFGGTFTMSGGTIGENTAETTGGSAWGGGVSAGHDSGVAYPNEGTFIMSGGTISGNTASLGGGVFVIGTNGAFTMSGGAISGNTAGGDGGGVFVDSGSFSKTGGTVFGSTTDGTNPENAALKNTASGNGHAAYVKTGPKKRDSTAGPNINLDIDASGNWD